jgi:hypothetical protein
MTAPIRTSDDRRAYGNFKDDDNARARVWCYEGARTITTSAEPQGSSGRQDCDLILFLFCLSMFDKVRREGVAA